MKVVNEELDATRRDVKKAKSLSDTTAAQQLYIKVSMSY